MAKYEVILRGHLGQNTTVMVEADGVDTGGGFVVFGQGDGSFLAMFAATDVISIIKTEEENNG